MKYIRNIFLFFFIAVCLLFTVGCGNEAEVRYAKACEANLRVLQGAVEMYNMDSNIPMKTLNEENYKQLRDKYLNGRELTCPSTNKFTYSSIADLSVSTELYTIKCEKHGTINDIKKFTDENK